MNKSINEEDYESLLRMARARAEQEKQESKKNVLPYSYSRAGQISSDQLRAIRVLNDIFARNLTRNLSAWLRCECNVSLLSAEQIPYSEYVLRMPELTYVASIRLDPLRALSAIQIDLSPIPSMIDLLLGGSGIDGEVRELTTIEETIVSHFVEIVCHELTTAWRSVGLSFSFDTRQLQTQMGRLMPLTERTLCLGFELEMPSTRGRVNFAFPAVVSNTILRRLTGEWKRQGQHAIESAEQMRKKIMAIPLGMALQTPKTRLRVEKIEQMREGEILHLKLPSKTDPEVLVAGVSVFTAAPVRSGEHRAAHLQSLTEGMEV